MEWRMGFGCLRRWEGMADLAVGLGLVCLQGSVTMPCTVFLISETWVIQKPKHGSGFYLQLLVPEPVQESLHSVIAGVFAVIFGR